MADAPLCSSRARQTSSHSRQLPQEGLEAKLKTILEAFWEKLKAREASYKRDLQAKDQGWEMQNSRGIQSGTRQHPAPATGNNCLPRPRSGPGVTKRVAKRLTRRRRIRWRTILPTRRRKTLTRPHSPQKENDLGYARHSTGGTKKWTLAQAWRQRIPSPPLQSKTGARTYRGSPHGAYPMVDTGEDRLQWPTRGIG
ncbi:Hypothetical predicted protein [Pelobates cultripes]|uniref:Uncharacterized protein n=1 Tax=Pelobates cultripes TaxID=61616 RepID=A0AAD1RNF0_PELCU|nr:Hypothetical predicted protein [Pelobates cultripes]CAH2300701.1 Hypothetical predicted protein [Pelobates cultripes]